MYAHTNTHLQCRQQLVVGDVLEQPLEHLHICGGGTLDDAIPADNGKDARWFRVGIHCGDW